MPTTDAPSANELFSAVERLDPTELEDFTQRVLMLRARRMASARHGREAELLAKAHETLPEPTMSRIHELRERLEDERLSAAEHEELIALTETLEEWNVRRWEAVAELATLRGSTMRETGRQLGLLRADDVA